MRYVFKYFKWFVFQLVILVFSGVLPNFPLGIFVPSYFFSQNATNSWKVPSVIYQQNAPFSSQKNACQCYLVVARCRFCIFFYEKQIWNPISTSIPDSKIFKHTSLYKVDVLTFNHQIFRKTKTFPLGGSSQD